MAHAWHIVLVGSIVFGGSGLIAMQQSDNKPEVRNQLSCSREALKKSVELNRYNNAGQNGGVSHHMDFGMSGGKQFPGRGIDDRGYFDPSVDFPGYRGSRLGY